jgi:ribosomal-protein-alanine N-acetyltransferase
VPCTLRDSRPADFELLWAVDQQCFSPDIAYSRAELSAYMRRKGAFTLVAEVSGYTSPVAGFLVAEAGRRSTAHIITIDVLPSVRRVGVGSALLAAAEERLRKAGCHTVFLEAAVNNMSALTFYKRHAYFIVRTMPGYYADGLDAFVLQKDLLSQVQAS